MALQMKNRDDPKSKLNIADHLKRLLTRMYAVNVCEFPCASALFSIPALKLETANWFSDLLLADVLVFAVTDNTQADLAPSPALTIHMMLVVMLMCLLVNPCLEHIRPLAKKYDPKAWRHERLHNEVRAML